MGLCLLRSFMRLRASLTAILVSQVEIMPALDLREVLKRTGIRVLDNVFRFFRILD
jgi:hypothetical protein